MKNSLRDQIALEKGYPSWEEMYDWISRDGEIPHIVAQQIESFMNEYFKRLVHDSSRNLLTSYDEEDTYDRLSSAYIEGCKDVCKHIISSLK